jgi:hypothetical protein
MCEDALKFVHKQHSRRRESPDSDRGGLEALSQRGLARSGEFLDGLTSASHRQQQRFSGPMDFQTLAVLPSDIGGLKA